MSGRIFDGRIAQEIAPDDRARQDRLKATARTLVTAVRDGLVRDGLVRLHGFGTFRLRPVAARRGRHPRTGEPIDIPAGWRVMFRPAKALRERIEPDRAPALPIGEPYASREAMLAASPAGTAQSGRRGAGRIPAEGPAVPRPDEPERAAAAAMREPRRSVHGPIPPGPTPSHPPEPADLEADSRVTRSPAALTRALAANEPSPSEPPKSEPLAAGPDTRPKAATDAPATGRGYRSALLVLLVLLLAGLVWLVRPGDDPAPPVADESEPSTPEQVPTDDGNGIQDIATTAGSSRDAENAAATADATSSADEGEKSPAAEIPAPSTAGTANTDDDVLAPLSGAGGDARSASADAQTDDTGAVKAGDAAAAGSESAAADDGVTGSAETLATPADAAETATVEGGPYFRGRDHTVRRGDTLWDLADRHYVNPYYWPHIWQHNADITDPDRLEVRQGLWLPTLEGDPRSLTEADRRSIAEGYLLLYRFFREEGDANPQYALVGVRYFDPSVLPERLRDTAAGHPGDTLAAAFQARLETEFPLD